MHVPDGFLDGPTSVATGVIAVAGVGAALWRTRGRLDEPTAPLAGLVAAFVFAAQMINFPVAGGTSGHLLGGALAAVLVGPWMATLCLAAVLVVQTLLFADGGVSAMGTNVTLFAVVGVWVGWGVFVACRSVLPRRASSVSVSAAVAAFVSVPATAAVFALLFQVGGAAPVPLDTLMAAMLSWHALIGIGEAVITFLVVSAVMATRPDLVHGAEGRRPEAAPRRAATEATR
ncbi:hypothetical protein GCM10027055_20600 [Janibacter alkaliphilus]|uniref:Cobalt/nickel transport system permease protein n=1 Tax=Janibacter alkaliphilus TaxID=1069963 RepID=A0A852X5H5_9MICO|nr:energy-coupling factor ABC transporter permease [Janibacter alkaliphilus]NYG38632.1 cobalt/nickel transport system permease protein [Janibacter alkaliphilus]